MHRDIFFTAAHPIAVAAQISLPKKLKMDLGHLSGASDIHNSLIGPLE
jgi:hypothetical protein